LESSKLKIHLINTKDFVLNNGTIFLLILTFFYSEFLLDPFRELPLNDDWSYAKTVLTLHRDGRFEMGDWPAMTLVTHLLWGWLFVAIFGFSFSVLHLSTLVSSLLGLLLLNGLLTRITGNRFAALAGSLCLFFNPLYFNLTNTYMTDVNFNTLVLLCCYCSYDFFTTRRTVSFVLFFISAFFLVLLRQYGLIFPACFLAACFVLEVSKWKYMAWSFVCTLIIVVGFISFEHFLKRSLPGNSMYKFSGNLNLTDPNFFGMLVERLGIRYKTMLYHILFYCFPFLFIFIPTIFYRSGFWKTAAVLLLTGLLVFSTVTPSDFISGNIFSDMTLGPSTFYQAVTGTCCPYGHTFSGVFNTSIIPFKYFCVSLSIVFMVLLALQTRRKAGIISPPVLFLVLIFFAYTFMILLTETYFDRYHIPLITVSLLLIGFVSKQYRPIPVISIFSILVFANIAIPGTQDYYALHSEAQRAYISLIKEGVDKKEINAGFEEYCWNEGQPSDWRKFLHLENFNYLIQYDPEPGFSLYRKYYFNRKFPEAKDSIGIFVRNLDLINH
jgi:ABC-type xylose transport system permease subunit